MNECNSTNSKRLAMNTYDIFLTLIYTQVVGLPPYASFSPLVSILVEEEGFVSRCNSIVRPQSGNTLITLSKIG